MQSRSIYRNIPIDLIRTVVVVSELRGLSRAAEYLGLSQPAISAQIKRIQSMVGGPLFNNSGTGSAPTALGKLVILQARRLLEANDQILRLSGSAAEPQMLRVGMSSLLLPPFLKAETERALSELIIHTDNSVGIARALADGYIDVGYFLENPQIMDDVQPLIVAQREEPYVWVRSSRFVLSPGAPVPILTWPGDDVMISSLTRVGAAYRIVFHSPDHYAILAGVEAGIGLSAIPARLVPANLLVAREYYLPELPSLRSLLCVRPGLDPASATAILQRMSSHFPPIQ